MIIAGAVWADRAYTAYTVYRDVEKVRSGEMSMAELIDAHKTDVVPGRGAVKAGQAISGVFKRAGGEVAETAAKKAGPQVPSAVTKHADDSPRMRDDAPAETLGRFTVGPYNVLRRHGEAGLDAHHVGQKKLMNKFVKDYDQNTAPAILVPPIGHTRGEGVVSRRTTGPEASARDVVARDIRELRRVYPDISNDTLKDLIKLNKKMYPEMTRTR